MLQLVRTAVERGRGFCRAISPCEVPMKEKTFSSPHTGRSGAVHCGSPGRFALHHEYAMLPSLRWWGSLPGRRNVHRWHTRCGRHISSLRQPLLQLLHLRLHHLFLAHLPARKYRCDELVDEEQDECQDDHPCEYSYARADFTLPPITTLLTTAASNGLRHLIHLPA